MGELPTEHRPNSPHPRQRRCRRQRALQTFDLKLLGDGRAPPPGVCTTSPHRWRERHETSTPSISAPGSGRCGASGVAARRFCAELSSAAGSHRRRLGGRRGGRRHGTLHRSMASERLGQPVLIENRPGAASNIATGAMARAPADGSTLARALAMPTAADTRRNWRRSPQTSSWRLPPWPWWRCCRDPHRADRVRECRRSGRHRLRREIGAARWQRHRICLVEYS